MSAVCVIVQQQLAGNLAAKNLQLPHGFRKAPLQQHEQEGLQVSCHFGLLARMQWVHPNDIGLLPTSNRRMISCAAGDERVSPAMCAASAMTVG